MDSTSELNPSILSERQDAKVEDLPDLDKKRKRKPGTLQNSLHSARQAAERPKSFSFSGC
jgi:hypothetical protein